MPDVDMLVAGAGNAAVVSAQHPSGTGLMSGAVFGRTAGHAAAMVSRA